jgi:hypothetical protein
MSYFIYQNGASIFEIHGTYANGPFSLTEIVSVGATIDFMIGEGYVGGTTPLHATLTYIPLPGAVWLLGSGLAGLLASRRFRKGGHP